MSDVTVFAAKKVLTMDASVPVATHIAVAEGRILAVGDASCGDQWGTVRHDDRLADSVLMPGLVEGHAHMMAGAMWRYAYAGYHDRTDPQGKLWKGLTTLDEVIAGLKDYAATLEPGEPLVGWGFDPIFLQDERLSRHHLDAIDADRPIAIMFSNFHLMCVNSASLAAAGYDAGTNAEGVVKGPDGLPTGELQEMAAMFPVMRRLNIDFRGLSQTEEAIRSYGEVAKRVGVTTITDLFSSAEDADVDVMTQVTNDPAFPLRLVPALGTVAEPDAMAQKALLFAARSTDKLRLGAVKLMTDGSIQGWTARTRWPGYVGGQANGIWNTAPEMIHKIALTMQANRVQMHIHVNGDEAAAVSLDALEEAARAHPWPGARHVLQHCQMMDKGLFERAAELGVCCNIFSNHIWYFGDQHATLTLGTDRAARMDAARTALDTGVRVALHSDAPVTPLGPLFTAWIAATRETMSGKVLGPGERITIQEALYAITMGAAYTLKMDTEIGSISPGKRADFAVLAEDPTETSLRDVTVRGTVLGGEVHLV